MQQYANPNKFQSGVNEQYEYCVSRVDPQQVETEKTSPNEAPPTTSISQFELCNELIMSAITESTDKATTMATEKDTPLHRWKLEELVGVNFLATATRKDKTIKFIRILVQKRDWEPLPLANGDNWFGV